MRENCNNCKDGECTDEIGCQSTMYERKEDKDNGAGKAIELTYGELLKYIIDEIEKDPKIKDAKAIIEIGKSSQTYYSSYVRGIEMHNGERVIKGTYYNGKVVED